MYKCLMVNKKNDRKHSLTSRSRSVAYGHVIKNKQKKKAQTFLLNPESTYSSVGHEHVAKAINTLHRFFFFLVVFVWQNYPSHEQFVSILCLI